MLNPRTCALLVIVFCCNLAAADWNRIGAARYLDGRQKAWFAWPTAKASTGVACVSCHTGMPYLLARPLLRSALAESGPTEYELALRESLRARIPTARERVPRIGVESVMAALVLQNEPNASEAAFERLWTLQIANDQQAGAWPWFSLDLDPYEMPESQYFGAALAAVAVSQMPAEYQQRATVRPHIEALTGYLRREFASQPLHHQLAAVWASTRVPGVLEAARRKETLNRLRKAQQPDGGWTIGALGPWKPHAAAPPQPGGSHNYATAYAAMILRQTGAKDRRFRKALDWLREHQERETGNWPAPSMNKVYKEGSMMAEFLGDAATAYAVIALSEPEATRSALPQAAGRAGRNSFAAAGSLSSAERSLR